MSTGTKIGKSERERKRKREKDEKKKGVVGKRRRRVANYKQCQGRGREETVREQDKEREDKGWDGGKEGGKET